MNAGAIFSLGELLIESGETQALGALVHLEPSVLPILQGGATPGALLDAFAALPTATEDDEIKAVQTILSAFGTLIGNPKTKARAVAALKGLLA